ncbi:hypothetical protein ACH4FX_04620 [Streptomyces sp. NPDC018019]|uniref:hypothetical protein n=1 Tax=Streptomyces sp. NPDC018019 TaxID=3365030 RepID=UPI003791AAC6
MRSTTTQPTVERAAAAFVGLVGVSSTVLLLVQGTRAAGAPAWLLPALAVLGAVIPPAGVFVLGRASYRAALAAFLPAAACHAAILGVSGTGLLLKILLGLSVGVSVLICARATLLRAEASENRARNRF